jgi:hypothetical protein
MAADGMKLLVDYPPDFVRKRGDCRHSSNSYERRVRVDLGAVAVGPGSTLLRRSTFDVGRGERHSSMAQQSFVPF